MAAGFGPPPGRWQSSGVGVSNSIAQPGSTQTTAAAGDLDVVSNAWKHLRNVVRDDGKGVDLFDLLANSVPETQYSFQPPGWPALLKPISQVHELPAMVMERNSAVQTVCFCGVFPEINRAWASVDNSLFLWRLDRWNDVPIEYSGEEQAICAVGLARPRPGVFVEAIQYVLVLCTTVEVVLLGVCCSGGVGGDGVEEVTLQPLPLYTVPSDNVIMTCVTATPAGRIFLGGSDGHLYEIKYSTGSGWREQRCQKVCHTKGMSQYLPSFLQRPSFMGVFQSPAAIIDIVVDSDRHTLYTRSQNSALQVFDLGASGAEGPRRVAEVSDFMREACRAARGNEIFGGRSTAERKGAAVVNISVIPPTQSQRLHLLAVTADGRRVWFTTFTGASNQQGSPNPRPDGIRAQFVRRAPPHPGAPSSGRTMHVGQPPSRGLEVACAAGAQGVLLFAEAVGGEGRSRLLMASRDLTMRPPGTATGAQVSGASLREAVTELEAVVPGETCALRPLPVRGALLPPRALAFQDDLHTQLMLPAPRFVLMSTAGVVEVEQRRPVEVLSQILDERSASKLEHFFKSYTAAEVACMCFQLVTAPTAATSAATAQQARAALENARLSGEPQIRDGPALSRPEAGATPGFDMGAAVPVAEPEWSGGHKGLALYTWRLLQPAWEAPLLQPQRPASPLLTCTFSTATLQARPFLPAALEERLRALAAFLGEYLQRTRSRAARASQMGGGYGEAGGSGGGQWHGSAGQPAPKRPRLEEATKLENQRTGGLRALAARAAEAAFLVRALAEHNVGRLAQRMGDPWRQRLAALRLRDLVTTAEGEAVAAQLISVLVTEHLSATGGVAEELAAALQAGCPAFFKEDDKTFYQASGLLQRAQNAGSAADRDSLSCQALALMMKVPLACDLGQVVPQLANLSCWDGVVELPLKKAASLDREGAAGRAGEEGREARQARLDGAYTHCMGVLKSLLDPAAGTLRDAALTPSQRKAALHTLLQRAVKAKDGYFHEVLYDTLIEAGAVRELLGLAATPQLEPYLRRKAAYTSALPLAPLESSQVTALEILAKLQVQGERYGRAAGVYEALATRRSGPGPEDAVALSERLGHLQSAVLQAQSSGDAALVERLEGAARVLELQQRLAQSLKQRLSSNGGGGGGGSGDGTGPSQQGDGGGAGAGLERAVAELQEGPLELAALYNDYAATHQLWGLCLEMVEVSGYSDEAYVRQLWDVYLKQAWDQAGAAAGEDGGDPRQRQAGQLEELCRRTEELGAKFFPNESSFPAAHVIFRLEQAAAGLWPERQQASDDTERVPQAAITACSGAAGAQGVYDELLARRGGQLHGEELHAPQLRLQLLRSLLYIVHAAQESWEQQHPSYSYASGRSSGRREVGALTESCERYITEARRVVPSGNGEAVANQFSDLHRSLEAVLLRRQ